MRLAFVFLLTVFYNTQLESSWGRNGDGVPTVRQLAKEISNLEKEGDSLMENINEINDNIETLKTTASNIESMVGSNGYVGGVCSANTTSRCLDPYAECKDSVCKCIHNFTDINGTCKTDSYNTPWWHITGGINTLSRDELWILMDGIASKTPFGFNQAKKAASVLVRVINKMRPIGSTLPNSSNIALVQTGVFHDLLNSILSEGPHLLHYIKDVIRSLEYPSIEYIGCYKDTANRDLGGELVHFPLDNMPQKCISLCKDKGYAYSSVQASDLCFCGDSYGKYGPLPESSCNLACPGDNILQYLTCGGQWANAVYRISRQDPSPENMRLALSKMYAPFDIDTNGLILIVMDDSKDIPDSDAISVAQQLKQNIGFNICVIAIGNNVDRGMMEGLSEDKHSGRHCIWNYDDWIDFGEALGQKIQKIKN